MKKFNKNSLLFVFVIIFIVVGVWGNCFEELKLKTIDYSEGKIKSFTDYKELVDDISNKKLSFHDELMDVNSVKDNLLGTRVINKDDTVVIKTDSGSLAQERKEPSKKDLETIVSNIKELQNVTEENGAEFLYCAAPVKELFEGMPANMETSLKTSYDKFIADLNKADVPAIDLSVALKENGIQESEMFYNTDHHWKTTSGFTATKAICDELEARYGFQYDKKLTDINNYNIKTYKDWFVGSLGKKVGTFFTWHGADDFDYITPKFETKLTEKQPAKNQVRNGSFEETIVFTKNLEKDYFNKNTYATYSGGDYRLQIVENHLNTDGKKILLLRDSYACVVAPFLSLQTSELNICDIRNYSYFVGERIDIEKHIKEMKPDYVLVLYCGISSLDTANAKYDFF